ncbi:MAG TPA: DNA alkylation repair protein, partial [Candidatus Limnocylindria bacterium]|nr:DNA alkylation repair protein [Candidatus Limnocylindria bacterium]
MARVARTRSPGRAARTPARSSARGDLAELDRRLRGAGAADRAKFDKAYLKSDLVFYGVTLPEIHRIARDYARDHPELDRRSLRALGLAAFKTDRHDLRTVAIAVIDTRRAFLEERDLPWLLDMVDASNTWAHVDWLATGVIGDVVARYPASRRWLPKWAKQKNFWIRRTAILAQLDLLKRGEGDWPMWTRMADSMLGEKEFFIRKAIGWTLREVSKKHPKRVYDYIKPRRERMSGLTLREGAKYLSDPQRRSLGLA